MTVIEIETTEGGRLNWVAVHGSTDHEKAIQWGDMLLSGFLPSDPLRPNLRVTDGLYGPVTGGWQKL